MFRLRRLYRNEIFESSDNETMQREPEKGTHWHTADRHRDRQTDIETDRKN